MENAIWEKLEMHKQFVINEYGLDNVLGVFVYGSQNYNLDTEESDVDTKAIIIPEFKDLCHRQPVSREKEFENGEHCEIKDIREMVKMFKKQNINFLEILFTKYCWINPKYETLWKFYFLEYKHAIAHYNPAYAKKSIVGQALHTIKQNPSDGKKIANTLRLIRFLERYLTGAHYKDCLVLSENERRTLLRFKKGEFNYTPELTQAIIARLEDFSNSAFEDEIAGLEHFYNRGNIAEMFMNEGIEALIAKNLSLDF